MKRMGQPYWKKGDKFYCPHCEELLFIFKEDAFWGDKFSLSLIVEGSGQNFKYLDRTNCKKCGHNFYADVVKGRDNG